MATVEEQLKANLQKLAGKNAQALVRADDLGVEADFRAVEQYLRTVLEIFGKLDEGQVADLPPEVAGPVLSYSATFLDYIGKVETFSIAKAGQNWAQERNKILSEIRQFTQKYFWELASIVCYTSIHGTGLDRQLQSIEEIMAEVKERVEPKAREIEGILEAVRKAAQETGIVRHAIDLQNQAAEHQQAAGWWLAATIVLCVLTLGAGVAILLSSFTLALALNTAQSIQLAVGKIIAFSVLATATLWCGRAYRSNRHNYVVNKHRRNALNSFEAFAQATQDPQIRNAVLLQATQCIFSPQHSGYITQESDTVMQPQILEIFRGITGGDGG